MIRKRLNDFICKSIISVFLLAMVISITACNTGTQGYERIPLPKPEITYLITKDMPTSEIDIYWTASEELKDYIDYYAVVRTMVRDGVTHTKRIRYEGKVLEGGPYMEDERIRYYIEDCSLDPDTEYTYYVEISGNRKVVPTEIHSDKLTLHTSKTLEKMLDYPKKVLVSPAKDKRNALTVTWEAVEGATSYEVYSADRYYADDASFIKKIADTTETSFTQENLINEERYCYRIKAVNNEKSSILSAKAEGDVPALANISKNKALMLENEVKEEFYSDSDSLWFKCIPQEGELSFTSDFDNYSGNRCTLSIFTEGGEIIASGLPLYYSEGLANNPKNTKEKEVTLNLVDLLADYGFEYNKNTTVYYLRITKNKYSDFSICIY